MVALICCKCEHVFPCGIDPHHLTCRLKKTHSESGIFTAYVVTDKAGGKNADSKEQQYIEVRVMFACFTFLPVFSVNCLLCTYSTGTVGPGFMPLSTYIDMSNVICLFML